MKRLFLFIFSLATASCNHLPPATTPITSPADVEFIVQYSVADPKFKNKFIDEKQLGSVEDPYKSKDTYSKYYYSKDEKPNTSIQVALAMDSKISSLQLKGHGVFRVEYEIVRVPIAYGNFINGGSFSISEFPEVGLQNIPRTELELHSGVYDFSKITLNLGPFNPPLPLKLKKHCSSFTTFPCSVRVDEIRVFVSKQVPSSTIDLDKSYPGDTSDTEIWAPLFDITFGVIPSYDNEENFYNGDLIFLKKEAMKN